MRNVEGGTGIQQGEAFSEMQTINIAARKKDAQVTWIIESCLRTGPQSPMFSYLKLPFWQTTRESWVVELPQFQTGRSEYVRSIRG